MRTPMTVVRLDCSAALSAALKACSVSTTTPSAPKDCASFSQSTPPICDAVQRNALDLLLDADQADFADRRTPAR